MKGCETSRARRAVRFFLAAVLLGAGGAAAAQTQTGNISGTNKYAWSENAGWLNFRPDYGGVTVIADSPGSGHGHLEGYAWLENAGWVRLGSCVGCAASYVYANSTKDDWGVNYNPDTQAMSGYAWSENAGWINFAPTGGGVTLPAARPGLFVGYAWSENLGWVHFGTMPTYMLQALGSLRAELAVFQALESPEGVLLEWETLSELDITGFHVWRSVEGGEAVRVTTRLVPARGGLGQGADYFVWDFDAPPGVLLSYWLEEVSCTGDTVYHGPVTVTAGEAEDPGGKGAFPPGFDDPGRVH